MAISELNEIRFFMNDLAEDIEVLWGVYRDNELGEQVKVALIATDFADSKVSTKEEISESEYQKALMDMYYGTPNRKKQEVIEEIVVDTPVAEPINEKAISEAPAKETSKPSFLDRFLKKLGEVVDVLD